MQDDGTPVSHLKNAASIPHSSFCIPHSGSVLRRAGVGGGVLAARAAGAAVAAAITATVAVVAARAAVVVLAAGRAVVPARPLFHAHDRLRLDRLHLLLAEVVGLGDEHAEEVVAE